MKKPVKRYEDTAANWAADNPTLPAGWEGVESDTDKEKHGDGLTRWNSLPYIGPQIQSAVLLADFEKTNDTPTAVPDLTLNLEAGHWYAITATLIVQAGDGGASFDFLGGTATMVGMSLTGSYYQDGTTANLRIPDAGTNVSSAAGFTQGYFLSGVVQVDVGGTFSPRVNQNVTDVSPSKMLRYSIISAQDITP